MIEIDLEKRKEVYRVLDTALLLGSDYAYEKIQRKLDELDGLIPLDAAPTGDGDTPSYSCVEDNIKQVVCHKLAEPTRSLLAEVSEPSLETFHEQYLKPGRPVVIKDSVDHWPAVCGSRSWCNLNYIKHGKLH